MLIKTLRQTEIMKSTHWIVHDFLVKKIEFIYEPLILVQKQNKKLKNTIQMLMVVLIAVRIAILHKNLFRYSS